MVSNCGVCMNQRLLKFALELQSADMPEKKPEYISFKNGKGGKKSFFNFFKSAFVTVPIEKD